MTLIASPLDDAEVLRSAATVIDNELPLSGFRAVLTERAARHTLEIFDPAGQLLTVVSDNPLDRSLIRGSWHGVRDGRPWSLVVGRSTDAPIMVTFRTHRSGRRRIDVAADPSGEFWLAEATFAATRVAVTVAGVAAGKARLHPVPK